jgi:hypothetical protein
MGTYAIPSLDRMEFLIKENLEIPFDEYQVTKRIQRAHPQWSDNQVLEELERYKRRHEKEFRTTLKLAAKETIEEVENLIKSLNKTIKAWKISHLE